MDRGRVKILRIISRLNIGGPTVHAVHLTEGLDPARFESVLVSGQEGADEGSLLDWARARHVQPAVVPAMRSEFSVKARDIAALSTLYQLIRYHRPAIVHTHTTKAGVLGRLAATLARVPVIVHTFHGHIMHGYYGPVRNALLRGLEAALARVTDAVVAVSEQVKLDLVRYGVAPESRIRIVPLGLDLDPFLRAQRAGGRFRAEIGVDSGERLIGIVGRLYPIKNHLLFFEMASRLASADGRWRFVIVGDGPMRTTLERHSRTIGLNGRAVFTGWRRDLPAIYSDLDALVISSDNEGTPVAAIEAMASGCPVVATRVGGLEDVITAGVTGQLVPPRDAGLLAEAVKTLVEDTDAGLEMGERAREEARQRFNVRRLIHDIESLYEELLTPVGVR